jgi:hypothetical protein
MPRRASAIALLAACLCCRTAPTLAALESMQALYEHIDSQGGSPSDDGVLADGDAADPLRTVGFLSVANWHSAKHSLPTNTLTYISELGSPSDLIAKVEDGTIIAAMIKGEPLDENSILHMWPSDTVTPQAVLLAPGDQSRSMTEAVDAAIVRMLSKGKAQEARQNNMPNNYMEIHTCKSQADHLDSFPFPPAADVLDGPDSVLKAVLTTRKQQPAAAPAAAAEQH